MAKNRIKEKLDKLSPPLILSGTLAAGATSLSLSDSAIMTESLIDIYTDNYTVAPTGATVVAGKITLTFEAQTAALKVKVQIVNEE